MPSDRALALAAQWNLEAAAIVGGETVPAGHRHSQSDIDDLLLALESRLLTARLGQPLGAAPLDANSKVPVINLPDISTTRGVFPVASQAAMLALNAQVGAVAVRSDLNGQSYILAALPASNLSNWLSQSPPGTVTSVNGQTGAVTVPLPAVATTATDGLMPATDRLLLSGQGAVDTQVLRRVGGVVVWANPAVWTVRTSNVTLGTNEACVANAGVTELTLPNTVSGEITVFNCTASVIPVTRSGAATISGISLVTGSPITNVTSTNVRPGQRATFIASGGNWIAQGTDRMVSFTYNGTPLTNNSANPSNAGGIMHYLGITQGGGTWVNPAGTPALTAVISSLDAGSGGANNMTNRAASGDNVISANTPNSWMGWRFSVAVRISSFIFQTRSPNSNHPRNFQVRVGAAAGLTSGTDVSTFGVSQTWLSQTQITAANTYYGPFSIPTPLWGNVFIWQSSGADSGGLNFFGAQEIELFGDAEI